MRYRTAVGSLIDERKISSGRQTYPTNKANYPLTQPIPKLESLVQCTGEAKFISDEDSATMLHAAFVLSEQANADILKIDGTSALKVPGVLRIVTAMDIPGVNNFNAVWGTPEELLATRNSLYAGQPVAIVVACKIFGLLSCANCVSLERSFFCSTHDQKSQPSWIVVLLSSQMDDDPANQPKKIRN